MTPTDELPDLILPLKGEYFKQIRDGVKPEEFRLKTDFWRRRIEGKSFRNIVLTWGYPRGGGVENLTRLTRKWRGYRETELTHPHFGADPVEVFAIDVTTPSR